MSNLQNLVLEELKVDQAQPVTPVVDDVLSPGTALDVDEHVGLGLGELYSNNGAEVAWGVAVGEVIGGESTPWGIANGSDILLISWVLALAGDPDHLRYFALFVGGGISDVLLKVSGHVIGELLQTLVEVWLPLDHLVEFEDNARSVAVIAPVLSLMAVST